MNGSGAQRSVLESAHRGQPRGGCAMSGCELPESSQQSFQQNSGQVVKFVIRQSDDRHWFVINREPPALACAGPAAAPGRDPAPLSRVRPLPSSGPHTGRPPQPGGGRGEGTVPRGRPPGCRGPQPDGPPTLYFSVSCGRLSFMEGVSSSFSMLQVSVRVGGCVGGGVSGNPLGWSPLAACSFSCAFHCSPELKEQFTA